MSTNPVTAPAFDPDPGTPTAEPEALPRWVQILIGSMLSLLLLPCLAGSLLMSLLPNEKAPVLAPVAGVLMVLLTLWLFGICFRLVSGRRVSGGLMSPRTLRGVAWLFLLLPLGGLFTGYFATHTLVALMQSAAYVSAFLGLRSLALSRDARPERTEETRPSGEPPSV